MGVSVQEGLCPGGGSLSRRGVSVQEVSVQQGLCPGGVSVQVVSVKGGLCPRESLCPGDLCPEGGGLCPGDFCPQEYLSGGRSLSRETPMQ